MEQIVNEFPVYQTLANGNTIIIIYDCFIFFLFVLELYLYVNKEHYLLTVNEHEIKKRRPVRKFLRKMAISYDRHGLMTVSVVLLGISLLVVSSHHVIRASEFIGIIVSFLIFIVVVYFTHRTFMRLDRFQDDIVSRYVDLVYYLILGHSFVLFADFISPPGLPLGLIGLSFALILCFTVMLRAIANPNVIKSTVSKHRKNQDSASIIKGMLVLVLTELGILFLMVYNCDKINPGFYLSSGDRVLDAFDLLYYTCTSFATIGYGDIYPVRLDGLFYSELVAIVIGLASMFSTACFVGAVIAGAAGVMGNSKIETNESINSEKSENEPIEEQ
ncbi:MAG: ion channel [Acetobacterium sp.]